MNNGYLNLDYLTYLFLLVGSAAISFIGTILIKKLAIRYGILDEPGERRSHDKVTPRGGGMAIVLSFLILFISLKYEIYTDKGIYWGLILSGIAISILGFLDDLYTLRRTPRIIAWILITVLSITFGIELKSITIPILGVIQFGFLSPVITFLWLIGVTNFFNFMDGINGLVSFGALISAGFLAGIAYYSGNILVFIVSVILFGSVLGFLPNNFPKAKIFLGDGGSNFLGYIFASIAVIGSQSETGRIPILIPVILLSLFLWDAGTILIKHLAKGKNWLEPHRNHYYQRLIILGYSHTQVTYFYSALNLLLGAIALLMLKVNERSSLVLMFVSIIPFLIVVIVTNKLEIDNRG